jgi:hypothetical protein
MGGVVSHTSLQPLEANLEVFQVGGILYLILVLPPERIIQPATNCQLALLQKLSESIPLAQSRKSASAPKVHLEHFPARYLNKAFAQREGEQVESTSRPD